MRKNVWKVLVVVMTVIMVFALTGCNKDEEAVVQTTNDFMSAMQEGDFEKAGEYATSSLATTSELFELAKVEDQFYSSMGVDKKDLSEESQERISTFIDGLLAKFVESYEIKDVQIEDGKAKVILDVTYGFDPDKITDIDIDSKMNDLADDYMEKNQSELLDLYQEKGTNAVTAKVISDLIPSIMDEVDNQIDNLEPKSDTVSLDLEKNDEDVWQVAASGTEVVES